MHSKDMMLFLALEAVCLLATAHGVSAADAEKPDAVAEYQKLVAQVKQLPEEELSKFDFAKLRKAFLDTGASESIGDELEKSFKKALEEGRHEAVIAVAEQILTQDFTDVRTHILKASAHKKLGQQKEYTFHMAVSHGLMQSILNTGDGKSFETAWHVYQVKEEYALLQFGLGIAMVWEQSLMGAEGRLYDVLEAEGSEGQSREFYFDVTDLMMRTHEQISGKTE